MLLILGAIASLLQCPDGSPPPCPGAAPRATTLAVLYFDNASRDTADQALAEAISEDVMSRLSTVPRIVMRSRYSVRRWLGQPPEDLAAAARQVRADYIATGSIRRLGSSLRVSAELVRAADNRQVWSASFEHERSEPQHLATSIAREVANRILGELLPAERAVVQRLPTRNARAFERYAIGNYLLQSRDPSQIRQAIREYGEALRLDRSFAGAQARYALAHALLLEWAPPMRPARQDSILRIGREAAGRAIALDGGNAEAWLARGYLSKFSEPAGLPDGIAALERSTALDPENPEAWHQLGSLSVTAGLDSLAAHGFQRALGLDASRHVSLYEYASLQMKLGRLADARRLSDSALAAGGGYWSLRLQGVWTRILQGDTAAALSALREWRGTDPDRGPCYVTCVVEAQIVAMRGDTAAARELTERSPTARAILRREQQPSPGCTYVVATLIALGERDLALGALAATEPPRARLRELRHPACSRLSQEPEYRRLLAETEAALR